MEKNTLLLVLTALACAYSPAHSARIGAPSDLRANHLPSLSTLSSCRPVFSWALNHRDRGVKQSAYRIIVNQTSGGAEHVVWDSGEVTSAQSVGVQYGGASPLRSDADFKWTVKWQDDRGSWSAFAESASFSTGLLAAANADWHGTKWVGRLAANDTRNQFRRTFDMPASLFNACTMLHCRTGQP